MDRPTIGGMRYPSNPLGVISLFIFLIYGIASWLLGASAKNLLPESQRLMVLFVVFYPCIVLWAFLWLVKNRPNMLYSPKDFRTDEGHLNFVRHQNSEPVGEHLDTNSSRPSQEELKNQASQADSEDDDGTVPPEKESAQEEKCKVYENFAIFHSVMEDLGKRYGTNVKREVVIGQNWQNSIRVDGFFVSGGKSYVVDVKRVLGNCQSVENGLLHLERAINFLRKEGVGDAKGILCIVPNKGKNLVASIKKHIGTLNENNNIPPDIEIMLYNSETLLEGAKDRD